MRTACALALAAALAQALAAPGPARADDGASIELRGFVASRILMNDDLSYAALGPLLPPAAATRAFFEVNVQPRLRAPHGWLVAAADVSAYLATREPRRLLLVNEASLSLRVDANITLLAGRERVIWGSGLAANPTDLVNPQKSLLDPEQQRTGAFLLPLVDVTTEDVTVSAFFSPRLETRSNALPERLDFGAGIAGARVYALIASTDVTLMAFRDFERSRLYGGASLSRFLGDSVEVHAEALVWSGPAEDVPLHVSSACLPLPPDERAPRAEAIAGLRYDWMDQTSLSLEYLYHGKGLDPGAFEALRAAIPCQIATLSAGQWSPPAAPHPVGHPAEPPLVLLRRHYAVAIFRRPRVAERVLDDLGLTATVLFGPEDRSLLSQLQLSHRVGDAGRVGIGALLAGSSGDRGELNLWPTRVVIFLDARLSY
jgi:hypothetical protein